MAGIDIDGIPSDLVAQERIVPLSRTAESFLILTDLAVTRERAEMLGFVLGAKTVLLEDVRNFPELQLPFYETLLRCQNLLALRKQSISTGAEEALE